MPYLQIQILQIQMLRSMVRCTLEIRFRCSTVQKLALFSMAVTLILTDGLDGLQSTINRCITNGLNEPMMVDSG